MFSADQGIDLLVTTQTGLILLASEVSMSLFIGPCLLGLSGLFGLHIIYLYIYIYMYVYTGVMLYRIDTRLDVMCIGGKRLLKRLSMLFAVVIALHSSMDGYIAMSTFDIYTHS